MYIRYICGCKALDKTFQFCREHSRIRETELPDTPKQFKPWNPNMWPDFVKFIEESYGLESFYLEREVP